MKVGRCCEKILCHEGAERRSALIQFANAFLPASGIELIADIEKKKRYKPKEVAVGDLTARRYFLAQI